MLREITIGQYYATDSLLHRLDPRVKIAGTLLYIISLFLVHHYIGLVVAALIFGVMVRMSNVPFRFMVKGLKPIMMMLVFTALLHLFCTPGKAIFSLGVLHITIEGVQKCIFLTVRLTLMMTGSSLMTLTTTPNQLTDGIEQMLRPLRKLHIPVHEFALMMSIALRFIPILMEELDKIMKAQLARGADFESGNFLHRLKNMLPILLPLFASAMRRANELAYAMDARCYHGGEGRTKMKPLRYGYRDMIGYISIVCYLIVLIAVDRIVAF
ncbi:MAG: energy-coupling factor transporter transmembrane component T family protein [Clostridium sp.]